jgi:membrane protease YdiL (CAAX protease family)
LNQIVAVPIGKDPVEKAPLPATRWGFWATLALSAVIAVIYAGAQGLAIGVMVGIESGVSALANKEELMASISSNGTYLSVGVIFSAWMGSLAIGGAILLRKGITLKEYLAVKNLPLKTYARWLAFVLIFLFGWGVVNLVLNIPSSDWMAEIYESAGYLPLLWVAVVVAAPLIEELFFRGFLFEGLRDSWMGPTGAVLVTSLAWAAIHMQYEMFQLAIIATLGILLGIAKLKTRSLYIPIAMHTFNNLLAMGVPSLYHNS